MKSVLLILILAFFTVQAFADSDDQEEEEPYLCPIWECEPRFVYYRSMEIDGTLAQIMTYLKKKKAPKKVLKKIGLLCDDIALQLHGNDLSAQFTE